MTAELNSVTRTKTNSKIFAYSNWDIVPVIFGVLHLAYVVFMFLAFKHTPWWGNLAMGLIYAVSISWNINGIAHNFIHNPYFRSNALNRLFSLVESLAIGFSQTFYDEVHLRHHIGNSDEQDANGDTIDWLSIYRYSHDGKAENVWAFTFLAYFRDDAGETLAALEKRNPADARWGKFEVACWLGMWATFAVLNWQFMLFFIPFYYLGQSLSSLNGFYRHYGGNPNLPIAWGVSSYDWLYNVTWFNNGYHAEHHYRPRVHWTQMKQLHEEIKGEQEKAGVRVIKFPHMLGFLDGSLKGLEQSKFFAPKGWKSKRKGADAKLQAKREERELVGTRK
jgi:fatty acid desaturase